MIPSPLGLACRQHKLSPASPSCCASPLSFSPSTYCSGKSPRNVHAEAPMRDDAEERRSYVRKCLSCGATGGRFAEPVTPIHPGDDALASVTAQALLEALPPPQGRSSEAPMQGRNLLVFADNRQDAAFFAPFFERTARDQALRAAMVQALRRETNEALDLMGLRDGVWTQLRRSGFKLYDRRNPEPLSSSAAKDRLMALIAAELCGGPLRLSLESLGLITVQYEGEICAKVGDA